MDGHNRYELCIKHGISYKTVEKEFEHSEEVKERVIKNQFGRRNLTLHHRAELALKLKPIFEEKAKKNQLAGLKQNQDTVCPISDKRIDTKKELAKIAGVSPDSIYRVETIQNQAPEPIKERDLQRRKPEIKFY